MIVQLGIFLPLQSESSTLLNKYDCIRQHGILQNKPVLLSVVGSLVFQPLAVSLDAANLLTIVVWDGVGE